MLLVAKGSRKKKKKAWFLGHSVRGSRDEQKQPRELARKTARCEEKSGKTGVLETKQPGVGVKQVKGGGG